MWKYARNCNCLAIFEPAKIIGTLGYLGTSPWDLQSLLWEIAMENGSQPVRWFAPKNMVSWIAMTLPEGVFFLQLWNNAAILAMIWAPAADTGTAVFEGLRHGRGGNWSFLDQATKPHCGDHPFFRMFGVHGYCRLFSWVSWPTNIHSTSKISSPTALGDPKNPFDSKVEDHYFLTTSKAIVFGDTKIKS